MRIMHEPKLFQLSLQLHLSIIMRNLFSMLIVMLVLTSVKAIEPFTVHTGSESSAPKQPQAFVGSDGTVHLAFGIDNDVYYCNVKDGKCSAASLAFPVPNMSLGMRRGPRIAQSGSDLVVTAIGGAQGKGRDGDILAFRSSDQGKTWTGPVKVNDVESSAREGLHAMTASSDGTLWCVWLDLRERGTKLFVSHSKDRGATWSKNQLAYRSPDGSVCECCHPSILSDKDSIHILFRNSLKGNRDMYLVSSTDLGASFGAAVRLGDTPWTLNACPMDGGMLAVDGAGRLSSVWRRGHTLLTAGTQAGSETLFGNGEQPWVTGASDGFYTVWTSKREGDLMLLRPGKSQSETLSARSSFPIVVSGASPTRGAYVFWEKRSDQGFSILGQRLD